MSNKETRQQTEEKLVKFDQKNERVADAKNDSTEQDQLCNPVTVWSNRPVNTDEAKYLTLLEAYDARLVDLPIPNLILPFNGDDTSPILEGEVVLFTEMLRQHNQLKPITVRQLEDGKYELLEGDAQIGALKELGYVAATAIVINCDDDNVAKEVRGILQRTNQKIPYKVCFNALDTVKQVIQKQRKELKKKGKKDQPTTNAMLAKVLGTSETYTKQLVKLASREDKDEIAKKLDNGESINGVSKGLVGNGRIKGVKPQEAACTVDVPEGYDLSAFCPTCPNLKKFQQKLKEKRELLTNNQ